MRAGGDDRRPELGPVGERDAGDGAIADVDRGDLGTGEDFRPRALGRAGDRLADRAHAADHLAPGALDPAALAERVVEQVVGGAGRPRAGPDADDAAGGGRALEPVELEVVVEQVADRHREHADELVDVALLKAGHAARLPQQPGEVAGRLRARSRGLAQHHRLHEPSGAIHQFLELRVVLGVVLRVSGDRLGGVLDLVEEEDRPLLGERDIGRIERDRAVAEVGESQVGDDLRLQHRDHVGAARDAGAGPELLGDAGAAEDVAPLEAHHLQPGAGEVGGRGEPVVTAADDDRVVGARTSSRSSVGRGVGGRGGGAGGGFHGRAA